MLSQIVGLLFRRFALAVREVPGAGTWLVVAAIFAATATACFAVGVRRGFLRPRRLALNPGNLLVYGLLPLVAPSFAEEVVYRAVLLPRRDECLSPLVQIGFIVVSLILFVASHPLRYCVSRSKRNQTFNDPAFLILATILGFGCTAAYLASESLWPSVVIHYACVAGWLWLLGGAERLGDEQ